MDESERFFKGNRKRIPFPLRVIASDRVVEFLPIQMEGFSFLMNLVS